MDVEAPDSAPCGETWPDGYRRAIDFYLREDVAEALYCLAQRRRLHFYYHTDRDYRRRDASRTRLSLHCPRDVQAFREAIASAAARVAACGSPFYPFFTMSTRANAPGEAEVVVGYDLCFECDLDLVDSFRALAPLVGVLERLRVTHLAKFSGQRSLHVVVPAEVLAPAVAGNSQAEWSRAHERLGRLLCRLVPGISATWVGIAKQQPLSAPYSIHRYNGLVGIPLSLDEALAFDPTAARIDRFVGASWRPEAWDTAGDGAVRLLELADESERRPERALEVAAEAFAEERWRQYLDADTVPTTPLERAVYAGAVGLAHLPADLRDDPALADRLRQAIVALDDPEVKTMRFQRLFVPDARHVVPLAGRAEASRALADWATRGVEGALARLADELESREDQSVGGECLRALRLFGLLPEPADAKLRTLAPRWRARAHALDELAVFLALAVGELAPSLSEVARLLSSELACEGDEDLRHSWEGLVNSETGWRVERDPIRALATLGLVYGAAAVRDWLARPDETGKLVRDQVFGGDERKLAHAGRAILLASG